MDQVATRCIRWGGVFLLLLLPAAVLASGMQEGGWITHQPVNSAEVGRNIAVEAEVEGIASGATVRVAELYYRTPGSSAWDYRDMEVEYTTIRGTIPGRYVTSSGIEYYIRAQLSSGDQVFYPPMNPLTSPVTVQMIDDGAEVAAIESGVVVISPAEDREYEEPSVLITAAFDPAVHAVNPRNVILRLDNRTITRKATVNEYLISALVDNVSEGRHRIDLLERVDGREVLLRTWHFEYVSPFVGDRDSRITYTGSVGLDGRSQQYNGFGQNILRETVNFRLERGDFRSQAYVRLTSEESGQLQPQHRFRLVAGWDWLQLGLGDMNPRYNELVLHGQRVRGLELRAKAGILTVQGIYGQLRRSISGDGFAVSGEDSVLVSDPGDPAVHDVYNTYTYDPGTFTRNLAAMRVTLGKPSAIQWGLTFMRARDDTLSVDRVYPSDLRQRLQNGQVVEIDYLRTPRDNLVLGSDIRFSFDRRRITWSAEAAVSLYNSDISVRPLDDAESLRDIIIVNQFFEPLPENFGGEGEDGNAGELNQGDLVNALMKNALSWQTRLRLRYFGHDLRTGYKLINRSYTSLGNPILPNDDAGFWIYDRVRLWDSRVYLNGGYRIFHNNVRGRSERTLYRNEISFGVSLFTDPVWPDVNIGYRQQGNRNDGELQAIQVQAGDDDVFIIDDRLSNATGTVVFGLSHRVDWMETSNNIALNVSTTARNDQYEEFGDSRMQMVALSARTDFTERWPVVTRVVFSSTQQNAMEDLTSLGYTVASIRASLILFDRKFVPYLFPKLTIGDGDYALSFSEEVPEGLDPMTTPKSQVIDFTRIDWGGGFEWRFLSDHKLIGSFSFTDYQDRGGVRYYDGTLRAPTNSIDRNDYAMMFSYVYQF